MNLNVAETDTDMENGIILSQPTGQRVTPPSSTTPSPLSVFTHHNRSPSSASDLPNMPLFTRSQTVPVDRENIFQLTPILKGNVPPAKLSNSPTLSPASSLKQPFLTPSPSSTPGTNPKVAPMEKPFPALPPHLAHFATQAQNARSNTLPSFPTKPNAAAAGTTPSSTPTPGPRKPPPFLRTGSMVNVLNPGKNYLTRTTTNSIIENPSFLQVLVNCIKLVAYLSSTSLLCLIPAIAWAFFDVYSGDSEGTVSWLPSCPLCINIDEGITVILYSFYPFMLLTAVYGWEKIRKTFILIFAVPFIMEGVFLLVNDYTIIPSFVDNPNIYWRMFIRLVVTPTFYTVLIIVLRFCALRMNSDRAIVMTLMPLFYRAFFTRIFNSEMGSYSLLVLNSFLSIILGMYRDLQFYLDCRFEVRFRDRCPTTVEGTKSSIKIQHVGDIVVRVSYWNRNKILGYFNLIPDIKVIQSKSGVKKFAYEWFFTSKPDGDVFYGQSLNYEKCHEVIGIILSLTLSFVSFSVTELILWIMRRGLTP